MTGSKVHAELHISTPKVTDRTVFRWNKSCLNTTSSMSPTSAPILHNTKQTNAAGNSSSYWCCKKSFHVQQNDERLHAPINQKKENKSSSSLQPLWMHCQNVHNYVRWEKHLYFLAAVLQHSSSLPSSFWSALVSIWLPLFSCSPFPEGDSGIKFAVFPFQH